MKKTEKDKGTYMGINGFSNTDSGVSGLQLKNLMRISWNSETPINKQNDIRSR